ncbi:hypothetical protein K4F52_004334 [Lecanicillium sp. MT-2017a]|nr:hypothetical protein K4F52_004334 [Lecanicillium sp. MT-2017a]
MRLLALLSFFYAAALAEVNITALISDIPECALECVLNGPGEVGCDILDIHCLCSKLENMTAIVAPCMVHANCTLDEIMGTGINVVKTCESEFNSTHNSSDGDAFGGSEDKPGTATRLYGVGWAALAASVMATVTVL